MHRPSSSSTCSDGNGQQYGVGYPRYCDFCPHSVLLSRFEFAQHLRRMHCTKEGGSFICRYGSNGVCQTLPLEGVSDDDYEAHIRKYHANFVFDKESTSEGVKTSRSMSSTSFTVHSFTQNLSSVLLDPKRSRAELQTFFTRHWGDSFVPKNRVSSASSLPIISHNHFKKYLETTAKKHRQCLRAKRDLRRTLARHEQDTRIDADDVPTILLDSHFSLAESSTFEAIFLEPVPGEPDRLHVDGKPYTTFLERQRCDSGTSLTPSISDDSKSFQVRELYETGKGRHFRSCDALQNCLEFYHDLVDSRLNNQLASKSNAFWKTVISCGSLSGELADAMERVALVRQNLKKVDEKLYRRMMKVISLYKARQQQEKVLQKLQDMACLRDAQLTVQMLLNQNDYPKALECIETAQDVLNNELRGVKCFRHLAPQLQELNKVISKMLYEEFVTLIQKELGRPCENESDAAYQGGQLNPIVIGLLRVRQFRFVHVLQQEIVEALKNSLRQIIKTHVVRNIGDGELSEFDPSLGNLSSQMRRMNFDQWFEALQHVLSVLYLMCRRIQSIQEVIIDNIEHFTDVIVGKPNQAEQFMENSEGNNELVPLQVSAYEKEEKADTDDELETEIKDLLRGSSLKTENALSAAGIGDENGAGEADQQRRVSFKIGDDQSNRSKKVQVENEVQETVTLSTASTPAAFLSMPCRTVSQVKQSVALLTEHTAYTAQERSCRLLVARSKDGFLERLSLSEFNSVMHAVREFIKKCRTLLGTDEKFSAPLHLCIVQQSSSFIRKFHEDRKTKLSNILDAETWRASEVPEHFQRLVDSCLQTNRLSDVAPLETESLSLKSSLLVDGESYVAVGTAFILLQMMAQYCDALVVLPEYTSELLMCVVELLKNYNSRSCQLILGAGALQLIGLKSISVRHLALSARCLHLILRFVPFVRAAFQEKLPAEKQSLLRHVDQVVRDYNDHAQEIVNKLISVIDHHLVTQLQTWEVKGTIPSSTFQQMCKQLRKFYNGLTGITPESMIKDLFLRVHENFKRSLKTQLDSMKITPHDSLTYGFVSQEYLFYMKSLQAMPCCSDMSDESISEALFCRN